MNKTELIDSIATQADISKAAAGRALDAAVETIKAALKAGDTATRAPARRWKSRLPSRRNSALARV